MPGHVDPKILHNLVLLYVPSLVVLYGIAIAVISRYPIKREDHEENLRKLAAEASLIETPIGDEEAIVQTAE